MSKRILVIENDSVSMELMLFLLKSFGFEPIIAFDGTSGLELAGISHPDLILCDVEMPGLSGIGVVRELRKQAALTHVPIIAVTAMGMAGDAERLLRNGFDGYIGKPVDPTTLQEQLSAFMSAGNSPPPLEL